MFRLCYNYFNYNKKGEDLKALLPNNKQTYNLNYKWIYINKELKKINNK